jgi:hypothetical protein
VNVGYLNVEFFLKDSPVAVSLQWSAILLHVAVPELEEIGEIEVVACVEERADDAPGRSGKSGFRIGVARPPSCFGAVIGSA